jgi:hypothetical protein
MVAGFSESEYFETLAEKPGVPKSMRWIHRVVKRKKAEVTLPALPRKMYPCTGD